MTIDEKLDKILGLLEQIIEQQDEQAESNEELREAISNLSLPGSGYNTFTLEED